jgi:peptidoglycan/xylan/chitin deacetylase (PgdA/CDA1 family)
MQKFIVYVLLLIACESYSQHSFLWPGNKRAAIILTYDDALASQLNIAIPQLDSLHLKGTFFLSGGFAAPDISRWRNAAMNGHELGNHTLYHPCLAATIKANPRFSSEQYDIYSILREIEMMNKMLYAIDGKANKSYAYPCTETVVGGKDYVDSLRLSQQIKYARVGGDENAVITDPAKLDFFKVPAWGFANNPGAEQLINFVKKAGQSGGLGVFMFHGVGGDYLNVTAEAHRQLLQYLYEYKNEIWVGTFSEVMDYIEKTTGKK